MESKVPGRKQLQYLDSAQKIRSLRFDVVTNFLWRSEIAADERVIQMSSLSVKPLFLIIAFVLVDSVQAQSVSSVRQDDAPSIELLSRSDRLISDATDPSISRNDSQTCACSSCCASCCNEPCCLSCEDTLFADSLSICNCLSEHGITGKGEFVQFYQGVASGGAEQRFRYGDKLNLYLEVDTGKLGLWEGGKFESHAVDWQFGHNSISDAVAFAPVNLSLLTPKATEPAFALTSLAYTQGLPGGFAAQAGRLNLLDLWVGFYPEYGRGNDGFMNVSTMIPLSVIPSLPLITNGAGLIKAGERGIEAAFYAFEGQQSATDVGLDFPNGVTLLAVARKYTDFAGKPGTHTLFGLYATGEYTSFEEQGWIIIPGGGLVPAAQQGTWAAAYVGEQHLWADPCNRETLHEAIRLRRSF